MSNTKLDRTLVLDQIGENLLLIIQWDQVKKPEWVANSLKYSYKAETLIELLEINDCNSVGGWDIGQRRPQSLFDRWNWLINKYNNLDDLSLKISEYKQIKTFFER